MKRLGGDHEIIRTDRFPVLNSVCMRGIVRVDVHSQGTMSPQCMYPIGVDGMSFVRHHDVRGKPLQSAAQMPPKFCAVQRSENAVDRTENACTRLGNQEIFVDLIEHNTWLP